MPTIKQEPVDPEQKEKDETISISSTSTADHFDQYGMSEALNMIAYHFQQLSEGYSQSAVIIPKKAPGEIIKALAFITTFTFTGPYDLSGWHCTHH